MKKTISIRSLVEDGACKEGIEWFYTNIHSNFMREANSRDVYKTLLTTNHQYAKWMKTHGYDCGEEEEKPRLWWVKFNRWMGCESLYLATEKGVKSYVSGAFGGSYDYEGGSYRPCTEIEFKEAKDV